MIHLRSSRTSAEDETRFMSTSATAAITSAVDIQASSQTHSKCPNCTANRSTMATPLGAFASFKLREKMTSNASSSAQQEEGDKGHSSGFFNGPKVSQMNKESGDDNPTKYASKAMMAIWGMYNRYSVHNFKSNMCCPVDKA